MSTKHDAHTKTAGELFDDCIKTEWPALFRKVGGEVHVRKADGSRYVPTQFANQVLKKNINAWDLAIDAWSKPEEHEAVAGFDRIIAEAGWEYTWEGILIDPSRPWAAALRSEHPEVVRHIEAERERREKRVGDWRAEREAEAEQAALGEDEATIALMNANRVEAGRAALSEHQARMVRDTQRERRERAKRPGDRGRQGLSSASSGA